MDRPPHRNLANPVYSEVTLVDGRVVLSDSDEWKHQCMAQHILNKPNKLARQALLSTLEAKHGQLHRLELERTIMALWQARQPAGAA